MIADVWCPWCRDHQRAELAADRDAQRTRAEAAEAECERLRAIVEGRTVAPTDAEIAAHAAAGGKWRVRAQWNRNSEREMVDTVNSWAPQIAALLREQESTHWWAVDADDVLCPWPRVTP